MDANAQVNRHQNMGRLIAIGIAASPGRAVGRARLVRTVSELADVTDEDVLIVRASNPAWTIGMLRAKAIVAELGGVICHAAIVAREIGIPCVVGVDGATEKFATGTTIIVDGTEGRIYEP